MSNFQLPNTLKDRFEKGELVAAIAIDWQSKEVLMLAWMNQEALIQTLKSKKVTYFSRSRNQLWEKGETSGNNQKLKSIKYDCDSDALLIEVDQVGAACHNGTRSCFTNVIEIGNF